MRLIALQTIKRGSKVSDGNVNAGIPALYKRETLAPGDEFDADRDEASTLVESGAAKRKTREVEDSSDDTGEDLSKMSKDELIALAQDRQIDLADVRTKADLIAALEAAARA